jgi:hypothetical protein
MDRWKPDGGPKEQAARCSAQCEHSDPWSPPFLSPPSPSSQSRTLAGQMPLAQQSHGPHRALPSPARAQALAPGPRAAILTAGFW